MPPVPVHTGQEVLPDSASARGRDRGQAGGSANPRAPSPDPGDEVSPAFQGLLPVQLSPAAGIVVNRLKRGAVLQPDGSQRVQPAQSQVLTADPNLLLYDEKVPREGMTVRRQARLARWIDGSTWRWTAYRKQVGRGDGTSNLRFDALVDEPGAS